MSNKEKREPFVSVLTPVYNGGELLKKCIESVLSQTYENWEYVIVNNCSSDNTLAIAESYAKKDTRIRIHDNKDFLEQKDNLNHAFRQISPESKYCKVVLADDLLFENCLKEMVSVAENYPNVGMVGSYYLDGNVVRPNEVKFPTSVINGKELGRDYLQHSNKFFGNPSNLLIKTEIILQRDEPYEPTEIHSDHGFCLDILREHDFGFVHQVLTFARRHEPSYSSEFCDRYATYVLGHLNNLENYGRFFLSSEEYEQRYNQIMEKYHKQIAKKTLSGDKEVINFHYEELSRIGKTLNRLKILKYIIIDIFSLKKNVRYIKRKYIDNIY